MAVVPPSGAISPRNYPKHWNMHVSSFITKVHLLTYCCMFSPHYRAERQIVGEVGELFYNSVQLSGPTITDLTGKLLEPTVALKTSVH